ncbi:MAG: VanZ family protein, partial [Lachnospiraceae bacterium]
AQLRTRILIPFALGVLYAASDEFHQLFVPGRSGQVRDVCIDSSGVMIGILLLTLVLHCARRLRRTC